MNSMNVRDRGHSRIALTGEWWPLVVFGLVELGVCPPTSRRRDVTNYQAVLEFVRGFDDRLMRPPSFVTANARSKEQASLLLAETAIRCNNSALYVTVRAAF